MRRCAVLTRMGQSEPAVQARPDVAIGTCIRFTCYSRFDLDECQVIEVGVGGKKSIIEELRLSRPLLTCDKSNKRSTKVAIVVVCSLPWIQLTRTYATYP